MFILNLEAVVVGFFKKTLENEGYSLDTNVTKRLQKKEVNKLMVYMEKMINEVLETDHYETLLYNNETVYRCKAQNCNFVATSRGGINYHIGQNHLGTEKLIREVPKEDKKYNYQKHLLFCGLLFVSFEDAIKEGDGDRIILIWRFLVSFFRQQNSSRYAFAGIQLLIGTSSLLTEREAIKVIWNRTTGLLDQRGCRVPDDLYNEFLNLSLAKSLPPNTISPEVIESRSKSLYFSHQVRTEYLKEMGEFYSKRRSDGDREQDFSAILKELEESNCFTKVEGRTGYKGFEDIPENIYAHNNSKDQIKWAQSHIDRFARHGFLHNDSTINVSKQSLDVEMTLDENDDFVCNLRSRPILRTE